jgi:CDP-diacylglycerol--serine O-phosphatidyltransferase
VKKIAVIPTLLTLGNSVCGFASIAYASKISTGDSSPASDWYFALSGWLIVGAMVFDALDGYVARLAKTTSDFGMQLDSLCDAVSFGLAPAFLLLRLGPGWTPIPRLHQALAVVAALYMVCALLRLARYNVETAVDPATGKRFRGLPSPGAAGCLASLAILRGNLTDAHVETLSQQWPFLRPEVLRGTIETWATLGALAIALLMVSRIPYPHLTKQILRGRRHFGHLVQVILFCAGFVLIRELVLVPIFWLYALGFPVLYLWARSTRGAATTLAAPAVEEPRPIEHRPAG